MPILDNPVLDGYIKGVQERREAQQQAFQQQQQTDASSRANQQLQATLENLKHQQAVQDAQTDLGRRQFELQLREHVQKSIASGQMPYPSTTTQQGISSEPQISPTSSIQQPDMSGNISFMGQNFPANQFTPPDQLRKTQLDFLQQQLKAQNDAKIAEATGVQPLKIEQIKTANEGKTDVADINSQQRSDAAIARAQQMSQSDDTKRLIAQMHDSTMMAMKSMGSSASGTDPNTIHQNALAAALGESDLTGVGKDSMLVRAAIKNANMVPFGSKDATRLRAMHDIEPLVDDMQTMINKYLPDNKPGILGSFLGSKIPASELKALNDAISARTGEVARTVGGVTGRFAIQEFNKAAGIMAQPNQTKAAAQMTLDALKRDLGNRVSSDILGGVTNPIQKFTILQKEGFDPGRYGGNSSYKNQQIPNFAQDKSGTWRYFDPKTQQYHVLSEIQ